MVKELNKRNEKDLEGLKKKIIQTYGQAAQELQEKAEVYFGKFAVKDELKRQALEKIKDPLEKKQAEATYRQWRLTQMAYGGQLKAFADSLAKDYAELNKMACEIVNESLLNTYVLNKNYAGYAIEKGTNLNLNFSLYNQKTIENLLKNNPALLPKRKLDIPKDKGWNAKKIQQEVTQAILQGEPVGKLADRLQKVTDMNRTSALRNAITATNSAQNKGIYDRGKEAETLGIEMKKEWVSALDSHTRLSHQMLDGEQVALDDKFSNGLNYPGDMGGTPSEIYRCRCALVNVVVDIEGYKGQRRDNINGEVIADMNYKDWLQSKEKSNIINILPKAEESIIPVRKFTEYALNHLKDKNKAKAFQQALGYNMNNADKLIENIRENITKFNAVEKGDTEHGKLYEIPMTLVGVNGKKANVKTGWILDKTNGEMRLTVAYVTKKKFKE